MENKDKVKAKKSLGQNWLKNERVIAEIVRAARIRKDERVLEVGPGQGALTSALLAAGARVVAVEKDDNLIEALQVKFSEAINNQQLELINYDILKFDPILINEPYKVAANLPYYITGEFLKKFLTTKHRPKLMVLLLQQEVVRRIIARDNKESVLSLSVKAYGEPKFIRKVPRGNFEPAPKVDSAVLLVDKISKSLFTKNKIDEKEFFSVIKSGFASKRKKLSNNLNLAGHLLAKYGHQRAEDLQLNDWLELCRTWITFLKLPPSSL